MAAPAGEQLQAGGEEKSAHYHPDSLSGMNCGREHSDRAASSEETDQKNGITVSENPVSGNAAGAGKEKKPDSAVNNTGSGNITEIGAIQPAEKKVSPPVKDSDDVKESLGDNISFNFLYYLFYKFDISQFFKTTI